MHSYESRIRTVKLYVKLNKHTGARLLTYLDSRLRGNDEIE